MLIQESLGSFIDDVVESTGDKYLTKIKKTNQVKRVFIDFETGSLDTKRCPMLSVSMIIEIDGTVVETFNSLCKPYDESLVTEKALEVNGLHLEQLRDEREESHVFAAMIKCLSKYLDLSDRSDRFFFVAHNAGFDDAVFRSLVYRNANDKKLRSKIFWTGFLCTRVLALNALCEVRHKMKVFNLSTICEVVLGPDRVADLVGAGRFHDAETDTLLCRELFYEVRGVSSLVRIEESVNAVS